MKVARIFLKPDGAVWFDIPLRPEQDCQAVFAALRGAGAIVTPDFIIPSDAVHHIQTIIQLEQPAVYMPPPNPDGKPN